MPHDPTARGWQLLNDATWKDSHDETLAVVAAMSRDELEAAAAEACRSRRQERDPNGYLRWMGVPGA